ncbi:histidinol dehydrogenase [Weissella confusa]|uniref:Histidinol dehydrogenase n=1 Tax=Weissella confusa TaxID=1583 RepID=A0AAJ2YY96_WEICO|nr:histidinol dehydrogenase [Weissella confusa]MBJ7693900.1 histidinol dehydrogenase [Weissella confusa]NBA11153.1 histidinol dehydrogenase [Weissella confusa]QBZ05605.1 histidinol dehydrogenase [Weissella confusa]
MTIKVLQSGEITDYLEALTTQVTGQDVEVQAQVSAIIEQVRTEGDAALLSLSQKFDGVSLETLQVTDDEIQEAYQSVEPEALAALREAAANITSFHERERTQGFEDTRRPGVIRGIKVTPLDAIGIYVPGGSAAYPSSVLMNAIPAKLAGVNNVIMVTPPQPEGVNPNVLVAADIAGVDAIYQIGGAQAIAALAYGTETIPPVDKITGPGNIFVATAKQLVFGQVDIDMIAGPSEVGIIADENALPSEVAADMLAQAEHDVMARALLVTDSPALVKSVQAELERQVATLPRRAIAERALETRSAIMLVQTEVEMFNLMNQIAPEHLELQVVDAFEKLDKVKNAGSVFVGRYASEPLGDYYAGPNHILPTGGTAKFSSALGVPDFQKTIQYTYYDREALAADVKAVGVLARVEGLEAHARAVEERV